MDLKQHVSDTEIRDYLKGELRSPIAGEVGLHLSYCPTCQELRDTVLIDEMFGDAGEQQGGHIEDEVFEDFWRGTLIAPDRLEEISRHCLTCRKCRQRRHDLWLKVQEESAAQATARLALALGIAALARRRRLRRLALGIATLVGVCVISTLALRWRNTNEPPPVQSLAQPDAGVQSSTSSVASATPAPTVAPTQKPEKHNYVANQQPRNQSNRPKLTDVWEQIAQNQAVSLKDGGDGRDFRGADEDYNHNQARLTVFVSRTRWTKINIELPQKSLAGTYLIYVQEPASFDTVAQGQAASPDGKALTVKLDMRTVSAGEYVLCVTRKNSETGAEEYLGHYPILIIDPASRGRRTRK